MKIGLLLISPSGHTGPRFFCRSTSGKSLTTCLKVPLEANEIIASLHKTFSRIIDAEKFEQRERDVLNILICFILNPTTSSSSWNFLKALVSVLKLFQWLQISPQEQKNVFVSKQFSILCRISDQEPAPHTIPTCRCRPHYLDKIAAWQATS